MAIIMLGFSQDYNELDLKNMSIGQMKDKADKEFLFEDDGEYHDKLGTMKNLLTITGVKQAVVFKVLESEEGDISLLKGLIQENVSDRYKIYKNVEDI